MQIGEVFNSHGNTFFQVKCSKQETPGETYELQLISGIKKQNLTLCGLKIYQGKCLKIIDVV